MPPPDIRIHPGPFPGCPDTSSVHVLRTLLRRVRTGVAALHGVPAGRVCCEAVSFLPLVRLPRVAYSVHRACGWLRTRLLLVATLRVRPCGALPRG
jgi:hypothetical protein